MNLPLVLWVCQFAVCLIVVTVQKKCLLHQGLFILRMRDRKLRTIIIYYVFIMYCVFGEQQKPCRCYGCSVYNVINTIALWTKCLLRINFMNEGKSTKWLKYAVWFFKKIYDICESRRTWCAYSSVLAQSKVVKCIDNLLMKKQLFFYSPLKTSMKQCAAILIMSRGKYL